MSHLRAACIGLLFVMAAGGARVCLAQATNPASVSLRSVGGDEYVNFSFDGVGLPALIRIVGDYTGRRFVLDQGVEGRVTVISPRVRRSDVYPLFVSVLGSVGCSVIADGDVYRIVRLSERSTPMSSIMGPDEKVAGEGVVTKIFRLSHVSASDVRKVIETRISGGRTGAVASIDETNHIVVTDTAENLRRVQQIIDILDQPGLARVTEVVPLSFASAEVIADALNKTFESSTQQSDAMRRKLPQIPGVNVESSQTPVVVASVHANSLLIVGTATQIEELKKLVAQMDVDTPSGRGRLNAVRLKYISAVETAKTLKSVLGMPLEGAAGAAVKGGDRKIAIEADAANNALLVEASPGDFEVVRKVIEELDQLPGQVHIEVVIAEVNQGSGFDMGVDLAAIDRPSGVGDNVVQASSTLRDGSDSLMQAVQEGVFPGGLSVGVAHGARIGADGNVVVGYPGIINIQAIKKDSRLKIRSNPSLVAQNNMEASVNIVNQIPVLTSKIEGGSGTARDVIQNIERVDVGIKLKITPHIIPGGEVRMELNPSIEAVIDPGPAGTQYTPTIAKREVSTTVTVKDADMIVIAGLTREDMTRSERRIPILSRIPLIGWLFKRTVESKEKTNLLIFVTPRIVSDSQAAKAVAAEMSVKTGLTPDEKK